MASLSFTFRRGLFCFLLFILPCRLMAREQIGDLLARLKSPANDSVTLNNYADVFGYYKYLNPDSASFYLYDGLRLFTQHNYIRGIANITSKLGVMDAEHGNLELAVNRQKNAYELFKTINNKAGLAETISQLGVLEGKKGNFDSATKAFITALRIDEEIKDNAGIVANYTNLGMVSSFTKDFEKSISYYNQALANERDSSDIRAICNLYIDLGVNYGQMGDFKKAGEWINKAKLKSNRNEYVDVYVFSIMNLAIVDQNQRDIKGALAYLDEALTIATDKKLPNEQMQILINEACVYGEKDPAKAIVLLNEALVIGRNAGNKMDLDDAYFNLVEFNKQLGNFKEAAGLLQEEMKLKDSLYNSERIRAVADMESLYDLERSRNEVHELQLSVGQDRLKRNLLLLAVFALLITVLFILLYLRTTRRHYKVVADQREELAVSNGVKDKLFSIIGHDLRGPLSNITMMLDMVEYMGDKDEEQPLSGQLKTQANATLQTLDSLLLWGRSQISKDEQPVRFNATDLVVHNIQLLGLSSANKRVELINELSADTYLFGNSAHFDFILRNMLSNAIKFSRQNSNITIGIADEKENGYDAFFVRDTGVGINKERQADLFQLAGASEPGTQGEKGMGIGLMLCREFVIANGGKIWVQSEWGKGSTFYFTFRTI